MVANHVLPKSTLPKRESTGARTRLEVAVAEKTGLLEAAVLVDAVNLPGITIPPTTDAVRAAAADAKMSTPSIATAAEAEPTVVVSTTTTMMPRIAVSLDAGTTRATGSPQQKTIIVKNQWGWPCSSLDFHF